MHDLAVITVSTNDVGWLSPCLSTLYAHAGQLDLEVIIADNESTDGTAEMIARDFPTARVVRCSNRGFGHANNRGVLASDARYVLFLNPDTEILDGSLDDLVAMLDARPEIGMLSVKQVTPEGVVYPTIRRYPNALRALGECIGSERFPKLLGWLGPRVLDRELYEREVECDWLTGAFMIVRTEALSGAGLFDERFFMSSEEVDLAYRITRAGWKVVHVPSMTILHHVHMGQPLSDRMEAQYAFARRQYAEKHFSWLHRVTFLGLVGARHRLRVLSTMLPGSSRFRAEADSWALRVLAGSAPPPFGPPPIAAVAPVESVIGGPDGYEAMATAPRPTSGASNNAGGALIGHEPANKQWRVEQRLQERDQRPH
jgi:GT2 family glycosyltransferase